MTLLDRAAYEVEFDGALETSWLPFYLPQWASREAAAARVSFDPFELRIDEDQRPWSPEYNGGIRVSNLQTGVFSGEAGTSVGQHHFRDDLVVRQQQQAERVYTPQYGLIEARVQACADPHSMVALWLIGFESDPTESGELCVFEIFGREFDHERGIVGVGIHPFADPALSEDFVKLEIEGDLTEWHTYSAEWSPGLSRFFIDDELVHETEQAPAYPLQLMLNIYEFEPGGTYPKRFPIAEVRGYRRR